MLSGVEWQQLSVLKVELQTVNDTFKDECNEKMVIESYLSKRIADLEEKKKHKL